MSVTPGRYYGLWTNSARRTGRASPNCSSSATSVPSESRRYRRSYGDKPEAVRPALVAGLTRSSLADVPSGWR
jgi:hypothetical protein